ncbi:poly-beta-1,6-N-acetyl-D-glucosamine biosynthesis protein PgaD [Pusillimonas sp. TS35]|uniref:poly-beta-1,6-N-acetyl-D-glucosamine biosynthesis protein PgaD n=1 Tax=Paracandidimonas lactea TaxID=2895524 RepID=UPI00136E3CA1|nr:poly-beta-1,6-N-acetyl-D-glucosamine biosynthesis protein PgaD [Paracandidimonas lactea]MYN12055.1 poly-beta-1,6-N-acetyl-D-glucosamine biosynthesis protein PgaD [Pusillimonas sp. TS35]
MIIKTSRAPLGAIIDACLTALGWAGLIYLTFAGMTATTGESTTSALPSSGAIAVFSAIAATSAAVVVLWGRYRKRFADKLQHRDIAAVVDEETRALHFHLSPNQLHEVQDSRVTVIYHSGEGDIAFLETDQLRMQPAGNSNVFEQQRVA